MVAVVFVLALAAWLAFESSRRLPRVAVLPFEDLGGPEDVHFAAGMTEEIIGGLATVHGLQVVSRTTVTRQAVRALGVTLSERERRLVEVPPTRNPEAYQLYLRGLQKLVSPGADLLAGADLMHRAAQLDPSFALAHAREGSALAFSYYVGGPAENRERARAALAGAQAAAPDDPRVRLAAG